MTEPSKTWNDASSHAICGYTLETPNTAYLQIQYEDVVAGKNKPFPAGTPVLIYYVDNDGQEAPHSGNPIRISGNDGRIKFTVEKQTNLYFEIAFERLTYLNVSKGSLVPKVELETAMGKGTFDTSKDMAFLLPLKFSLKNSWWDLGSLPASEAPKYDTNARLFQDLKNHKLIGKSGYLEVTLKPQWQYLAFEYPDRPSKSAKRVPQTLLVAGYNLAADEDKPVTISNLYVSECVCVPWILDGNKPRYAEDGAKILYEFFTKDLWMLSGSGLVNEKRDTVRSKPLKERAKYFDLPERWRSNNWKVRHGTSISSYLLKEAVKWDTNPTKPFVIELDAVVFADEQCRAEDWERRDTCTVFDWKMGIVQPRTDRPFLTQGPPLDSNFLPRAMCGYDPRVVAADGVFFDVTDKRTLSGGVIGARAAVRNDAAVHAGEEKKGPVVDFIGNFELHYFADCLNKADNEVSVLLIYWSCRFKKESSISDDHLNRFHSVGMIKSKERWEKKGYTFTPRDTSVKREVVPVYFFEGRDHDPYKCTVNIHPAGGRANMGLTEGNFKVGTNANGSDADYNPCGNFENEDGQKWFRFTMAHELGHATGLHDEYLESLEEDSKDNGVPDAERWNPPLPKFDQYYTGMPYSADRVSMMVCNRVPRLRHFWFFCRWLNETEGVKRLTKSTLFQVHSAVGSLDYFLDDAVKIIYRPAHEEKDYHNGSHGIFDLALYRIGNDEGCSRLISGMSNFDAILAVRHRLQWFFEDQDGHSWSGVPEKLRYLRRFVNTIASSLGAIYLSCPTASVYKNVYVYFIPNFYFEGTTIKDHFEVTVKSNKGGAVKYCADFDKMGFSKDEFTVDALQDMISIFRYVLGLDPCFVKKSGPTAAPSTVAISSIDVTKGQLDFLGAWVSKKLGGGLNYTVKIVP